MNNLPVAITYPRSGLNFFLDHFSAATNIDLIFSHNFNNFKIGDFNITVARNPKDCVFSYMAMSMVHNTKNVDIDTYIKGYNEFYDHAYEKSSFIIKFDDLINDSKNTILSLCQSLSIEYDKDYEYKKLNRVNPSVYIESSKKTIHYKDLLNYYSDNIFINSYSKYNKLISRS